MLASNTTFSWDPYSSQVFMEPQVTLRGIPETFNKVRGCGLVVHGFHELVPGIIIPDGPLTLVPEVHAGLSVIDWAAPSTSTQPSFFQFMAKSDFRISGDRKQHPGVQMLTFTRENLKRPSMV